MQSDGNFVIYTENRQPIWATGTNGKGASPYKLAMQARRQPGGVWILQLQSGPAVVRTGTAPFTLIMQDDGNLVVYDSANRFIWASNTNRP